jgi:hypothetical protein
MVYWLQMVNCGYCKTVTHRVVCYFVCMHYNNLTEVYYADLPPACLN